MRNEKHSQAPLSALLPRAAGCCMLMDLLHDRDTTHAFAARAALISARISLSRTDCSLRTAMTSPSDAFEPPNHALKPPPEPDPLPSRAILTASGATVPSTPSTGSPRFIAQTSFLNFSGSNRPVSVSSWPEVVLAVSTCTCASVLGTRQQMGPLEPAGSSRSQSVILSNGTVFETLPTSWKSHRQPALWRSTTKRMPSRVMAR
mmetsp:Transcript_22518/g.60404  ORF Transcript_22518/g.60404 Transcript_22518/m.60404 type:complete len:204 (-) Transcript_22518:145-756(-)